MKEEDEKKSKSKKKNRGKVDWPRVVIGSLVVGVVAFFVCIFFCNGSRTVVTQQTSNENFTTLTCSANTYEGEKFFDSSEATDEKYEVKGTFNSVGALNQLFFKYHASFKDAKAANGFEATTHADYNIALGNDAEKISPYFTVMDENEFQMTFFADKGEIDAKNANYFLLDNVYNNLDNIKQNYASKGFKCQTEEKK